MGEPILWRVSSAFPPWHLGLSAVHLLGKLGSFHVPERREVYIAHANWAQEIAERRFDSELHQKRKAWFSVPLTLGHLWQLRLFVVRDNEVVQPGGYALPWPAGKTAPADMPISALPEAEDRP